MIPVFFPEVTNLVAKDQKEYIALPAHVASDPQGTVTSCWMLDDREIEEIIKNKCIWSQLWTFHRGLQPQLLIVDKPLMIVDKDIKIKNSAQ